MDAQPSLQVAGIPWAHDSLGSSQHSAAMAAFAGLDGVDMSQGGPKKSDLRKGPPGPRKHGNGIGADGQQKVPAGMSEGIVHASSSLLREYAPVVGAALARQQLEDLPVPADDDRCLPRDGEGLDEELEPDMSSLHISSASAALAPAEAAPGVHLTHVASVVGLHGDNTREPGAHTVHFRAKVWPARV